MAGVRVLSEERWQALASRLAELTALIDRQAERVQALEGALARQRQKIDDLDRGLGAANRSNMK